jgi:tripartite-type tricarboxylate transporter receptor subunit TctC
MRITRIDGRGLLLCAHMIALVGVLPTGVAAQQAGRPVTIVTPYSPGTGVDLLARLVGEELQKQWGQTFIVDNKPGASGAIGTQIVARAAPDGHTLLIHTDPTFTAHASMVKNLPYDPVKSFSPIIELAAGSLALVTHASIPVTSISEFVAYAKSRPGAINYGTPGVGTPHHLTMEFFKLAATINLQHVPFRDSAGLLSNLLGGHVSATFMPVHFALPLPKDKVRILAVTSAERIGPVWDTPTIAEQGFPGFASGVRFGILGPAGMPRDVVTRYNTAINDVLRLPHVIDTLSKQGLVAVGGGAEGFGERIAESLAKWRKVVTEAGIVAQ